MFRSEQVGVLSAVFPGPVRLRLSQDGQLFLPLTNSEGRGQVCEQLWLSRELFGLAEDRVLFATLEEFCRDQDRAEGGQGEQLVLRSVQLDLLKAGRRYLLGDVLLECCGQWDVGESSDGAMRTGKSFPVFGFRLIEAGLVEPGVPLIMV